MSRLRVSLLPATVLAAAVLLSMEEYERGEHERQLLRLIARGEQEIGAGKGFDLDSVLAEADELLGAAAR